MLSGVGLYGGFEMRRVEESQWQEINLRIELGADCGVESARH